MRTVFLLGCLCLCLAECATPQSAWRDALSYDGGGHWNARVPVTFVNDGAEALDGTTARVTISASDGTSALMGAPVASLRAAMSDGPELIFDLQDAQGLSKRSGAIAEGDVAYIPLQAAAGASVTIYLYAGNASACLPPEWFHAALSNLDFEQGSDAPEGWWTYTADATHRMSLDRTTVHSGAVAARCDVDAGAASAWVKYAQGGVPVLPGQRYRFTGWVKGENVAGTAGWYVHVNGTAPQMVNLSQYWDGTFDWNQSTLEFTVPPGGATFECGTLLYGTGTAWFDAARFELLDAGVALTPQIGAAERYEPAQSGDVMAWPAGAEWRWRIPIRFRNDADTPLENSLVAVDAQQLRNSLAKLFGFLREPGLLLLDAESPETPLPYAGDLAGSIQFVRTIPARTEKTVWAFLDGAPQGPGHSPQSSLMDWVSSAQNMALNGDMESGTAETPDVWRADNGGGTAAARRIQGGVENSWCLELNVPAPAAPAAWPGWHQRVAVQPNTRYLLSGYLKGENVSGPVCIYGHLLRADGAPTEKNPYLGTYPTIANTQDWTYTRSEFVTPPDGAFLELHLTMNQSGTLWHDAIFLDCVAEGVPGAVEQRDAAANAPETWVVNPLVKVFHDDMPPAAPVRQAGIAAARNSYEPFQLALRSPVAGDVQVQATALTGPGGVTLDAPAIAKVTYVPIDFPIAYDTTTAPAYYRMLPQQRGNDGWRGEWPDALEPLSDGAFSIEANTTLPLFFDMSIPADATPGAYQGTVTVDMPGQQFQVPVTVTVWNFTSPDEKHLPAMLDLRNGPGWNIFGDGAQHDEKVRMWHRFLARYNVSPSLIEPYPTFSFQDGQVTMDATKFDEAATYLLDELHVAKVYTPDFFYACGWAYQPQRIFGLEPFTPEYNKAWTDAYTLFINHITERGWRNRFVFYLSDEPHKTSAATIASLAQLADMARAIAPDVPIYSSTWEYIEGLANHLTLWGIGPQGSFDPVMREERRAAGDHFFFTTDGQMCTDTPLLAIERLLPWFCFRYNVEAYEFWGVSWWTYTPWDYGWHSYIRQSDQGTQWYYVRYPNGDGFLTYPSRDAANPEPVPTIRLVAVRDGVDDFEVFHALDAFAQEGNAEAQTALDRVRDTVEMPNPGGRYSTSIMQDPDAVQTVRKEAGDLLSRLNSETGTLQVTLMPETARNAGAQWQVDGGAWRDSGETVPRLAVGNHTVSFKSIDGWTAPGDRTATIAADTPATLEAEYERHYGIVTINPAPETATWTFLDGDGALQAGNGTTTLTGVPTGAVTLTWEALPGYTAPAENPIFALLQPGAVLNLLGIYTPLTPEGNLSGDGAVEGEGAPADHAADTNHDTKISLSELLRVVQFFNSNAFHCDATTEDGYAPNPGDTGCTRHSSDFLDPQWKIYLTELLRLIQFFNVGGYRKCTSIPPTEDGYCPKI